MFYGTFVISCIWIYVFLIASQMLTLGRMLSVMIGHFIPQDDEHWIHYIQLLYIIYLIFAPTVNPETPGYLEVLIEDNLEQFVELYRKHTCTLF